MSKLAHLVMVLPSLSSTKLKQLENVIYNFIWGGSDKVARVDAKMSPRRGPHSSSAGSEDLDYLSLSGQFC